MEHINLKIPSENYLFEPRGRNTAPAIALAAFTLFKTAPQSLMIVLPADHYIKDRKAFLKCIKKAVEIAKKGYLVTFGIVPSRAETGYGYIECGVDIDENVCEVKKFKEKPSQKKANEFYKKDRFLWNSGIFVWETKRIIEEFHRFQKDFAQRIEKNVELNNKKKKDSKTEDEEVADLTELSYEVRDRNRKMRLK